MIFAGGARQLVVQEALETMWWLVGVVLFVVHAHHDGQVDFFGGCRYDHLPGTRFQVSSGLGTADKNSRGLDHQVNPHIIPGNSGGVPFGKGPDGGAVHHQIVPGGLHFAGKQPVVGIVFEEAGVGLHVEEVVDRHDLEGVRVALHGGLDDLATNPSESIYADPKHGGSSLY